MEIDPTRQRLLVTASLIVQGLFEETEVGIKITAKGKIVARDKWMKLPDEDKLLFGWLTRTLHNDGVL